MSTVRFLSATLMTAALLVGCQAPGRTAAVAGAPTAAMVAMAADDQLSSEEERSLLQALDGIAPVFSESAPQPVPAPAPGPTATKPGLLYRGFARSSILRGIGAKISEPIVFRHFSKPGTSDSVAPLSAAEIAHLASVVQPGDIIQCGNNASFVHAAFYEGNGMICHALAQSGFGRKMIGVRREPLVEYFERVERDKVVVLRPTWTAEALAKAVAYAKAQEGKPYDTLFVTDADDRHYCTELVWHILTNTGVAKVEPHLAGKVDWRVVTNEDIRKTPDLQVVWTRNHD